MFVVAETVILLSDSHLVFAAKLAPTELHQPKQIALDKSFFLVGRIFLCYNVFMEEPCNLLVTCDRL